MTTLFSSSPPDRRGIYFAFQGLLMAVLLLLFLFSTAPSADWIARFWILIGSLTGSLLLIRSVSEDTLGAWWFQSTLFVGDSLLAALALHWSSPDPSFFALYFLVIFGTALTRQLTQSLLVAAAISILYFLTDFRSAADHEFWIRLHFLWVCAGFMALLSRDSQLARIESDEQFRERLARLESLATIGRLAGEVAHRIKGPLTTIRVNSEVLSLRVQDKEARKELLEIQREVERCKSILKDLLDLGRIEEIDYSPIDLREPLRSALKTAGPSLTEKKIIPNIEIPPTTMPTFADAALLSEAIGNILHNAVESLPHQGKLEIRAHSIEHRESWLPWSRQTRTHRVIVADQGKGVARSDIEHVFQPFFTTKGTEGSGLGLSAALRILQKHGGSVRLESKGIGKGTTVILEIPSDDRPAQDRIPSRNVSP